MTPRPADVPTPAMPFALDDCAREPIHMPGAIQPHGALLAFDAAGGGMRFASANLAQWLPWDGSSTKGRALYEIVGEAAAQDIGQVLRNPVGGALRHQLIDLPSRPHAGQPLALVASVHQHRGMVLIEFEPALPAQGPHDWMQAFSDIVDPLQNAADLDHLVQTVVQRVKCLTGFDRVMVYRFSESMDGQVIADAHAPDLESLLDMHYPASDIPAQARELYRSNLVRYLADASYQPVPILPLSDVSRREPLDLGHSMLRSVSPMHIQYLHNMGVCSTLTISLLVDGQLWGLIVCHHRSATALPIRLRRACHALSVTMGYMVGWHARRDRAGAVWLLAKSQARVIAAFSRAERPLGELVQAASAELLLMAGATGGALWCGGQIHPFGAWPGVERGASIVRCVRDDVMRAGVDLFSTEHAELQPVLEASELSRVCGLMALALDCVGQAGIVWLRPEHRREVTWGGDPDKPVLAGLAEGRQQISARASFARWEVLVRERCRPWSELDVDAVRTLLPLRQVLATRDALAQVTLNTTRFRALVALQSDIYWRTDEVGRLVTFSKPPPSGQSSFLGRTLPELLAPGCTSEVLDALKAALEAGQVFRRLRISGRREPGNSRFDLLLNGEPLLDDGGRFEGWQGTVVDVTRDTAMHAALRQQEAAETDKLRVVALLAAGIAHDFNNLLGSINGLAELCELDAAEGSRQARNLERIRQAGDRAALLVRQMLDFSRQTPMALQRLAASAWLAASEALLRAALPRTTRLTVSVEKDGAVQIDPVQMDQVLLNITGNAAHAMRGDAGTVHIVVDRADPAMDAGATADSATAPGHLRLRVIDSGEGMGADVARQIFDPFFTTKPVGEGTGLGLAAAHGIVGSHGGVIEVCSELGVGSTFSIFLPLAEPCVPRVPHPDAGDSPP